MATNYEQAKGSPNELLRLYGRNCDYRKRIGTELIPWHFWVGQPYDLAMDVPIDTLVKNNDCERYGIVTGYGSSCGGRYFPYDKIRVLWSGASYAEDRTPGSVTPFHLPREAVKALVEHFGEKEELQ